MNHRLNKLVAIMMIAAMTLPLAIAQPTESHAADAIWIEPSTNSYTTDTTSVGYKFIVTVYTNTSGLTYTWQVKMYWNTAHLNLSDAGYTGVGKSEFFTGHGTVPVVPAIDYLAGSITHGESLVGTDSKAADVGSLFWAEFEIIAAPGKGGVLDSDLDIDNVDTYWLDPNLDEITTSKYHADYTYTWATPPSPYFAVSPPTTLFDHYTNATDPANSDFSVDIMLMGVSAAWYVHNATVSLSYNATLIAILGVTLDPLWTGPNNVGVVPGTVNIVVRNPVPAPPSGNVRIATIDFRVIHQLIAPPADPAAEEISPLDLHDMEVWDTTLMIPLDTEEDGEVIIQALVILILPYLEVSDVTMGPEPCRGELFNVTVSIKNLDWHWYLIGIEFRLAYDPFFITPEATHIEGPFLPSYAAYHNALGYPGTFWQTYNEPGPPDGPHVLAGELIYPNASGWWNTNETLAEAWPGGPTIPGEGVVAILQFRVNYQSYGEPNMTSPLTIIDQLAIGLDHPDTQNIVPIPMDPPVNANYTITTNLPGRVIDVYGGALNRGYGSHPFPAPYGGQGPDNPMDLVIPQAEVCLFANVTYNYWPVQNKLVGFEVEDPYGGILLKRTATTDYYGVACICFEMPWPCDDPESLIGVWTVTVTVDISDFRINDTLEFHYDYMVNIWKVTTDMYEYNHCDWVEITIEYGTHAQQWYPLLLSALIMDELIVPVGIGFITTEVGGAEFCSYNNFTDTICIHIPKWAFAGIATIHVNAYDRDPTEGGVAWAPEFTPPPIIAIQPY
jgi:hypothetical protein